MPCPGFSHAIPRRPRLTTPQKPHDFNVSVSKSEMLSRELHATFAGLHPIGSIAPDQNGCIVTDEVHDPIGNKRQRGYTSRAARSSPTGPTLRTTTPAKGQSQRFLPKRCGHQTSMTLVPQWCYTTEGALHQLGASAMLPNWCRPARHGSAGISLEQLWGRPRRKWACCYVALHHLAQHCTG